MISCGPSKGHLALRSLTWYLSTILRYKKIGASYIEQIMDSLPVVDFSLSDRGENIKQVVEAMETVGFLFLDNVPGFDESVLRKQVDWFYSLPLEKKMTLARRMYNPQSTNVCCSIDYILFALHSCARY